MDADSERCVMAAKPLIHDEDGREITENDFY
jgi:hypothetical protein